MSAATTTRATPYYFVPSPSRHPATIAAGMFFLFFGGALWLNDYAWGPWLFLLGLVIWLATLFVWFRDAIGESEGGLYSDRVDISYRWSMSWFIFSEVMFFGAFFGALYWVRVHSLPMLGDLENKVLWPDFNSAWPSAGSSATGSPTNTVEPFQTMGPWPIPTLNTAILLTSALTVTIAHHALIANRRAMTIVWMWITVALGLSFLGLQAYEYTHAYETLNLKLSSGVYGSTFFLLTGFHGFHVFMGMLMLTFITLRLMKGHFTPERHFGFEGAAWYWHFVDVVWLGLYFLVYWL